MKRILIALLVMMTIFSLANAQKQTTIVNDSTGNVKVTVTKGKGKDAKVNVGNTAVTVIGIDDEDADTTSVDTGKVSSSSRGSHGKASFTISSDDDDFPFNNFGDAVGGGILVAIISIIAIFGMPVFIIFVVFFFRYKNRKARYRLAEQALAAGQPLPEEFIRENKSTDQRTQGIKNTFTGIGLFIFLWAITGEFGIGAIGLLSAEYFKKIHIRDTSTVIILVCVSFLLVTFEDEFASVIPFASLIAVMTMGIALQQKRKNVAKRLSAKFNKLWVGAEVMLFVLVGATVDIRYAVSAGVVSIVLIFAVLVFRMLGVFLCLLKTKLTMKERMFCVIAYMPKATVQAAIGGVPLAMGLSCGNIVLTVAVTAILITAPLGAFLIEATYKKWLGRQTEILSR